MSKLTNNRITSSVVAFIVSPALLIVRAPAYRIIVSTPTPLGIDAMIKHCWRQPVWSEGLALVSGTSVKWRTGSYVWQQNMASLIETKYIFIEICL